MKQSDKLYYNAYKTEWEDLGSGVSRQILGWDEQIMMVKVKFEKGSIGNPHHHIHSQTTYCESGRFQFTIGENDYVIKEGDGIYVPPDMVHSAICLEEGMLLDVFSPYRKDFI
ncbi:cupin domain-containing protein [Bacteroidota bacterium]